MAGKPGKRNRETRQAEVLKKEDSHDDDKH
jgi:hypothetical protein